MPTLSSVIAELSDAAQRIDRAVRISITRDTNEVVNRLRAGSPMRTGELRYGWRLGRAFSAPGVVASIRITNSVPHAAAIEYGVDPNSATHPWAISLRKPSKKGVKPKVVVQGGRIWSSSAVGGVSHRAITPAIVRGLARNVADAIISAIAK